MALLEFLNLRFSVFLVYASPHHVKMQTYVRLVSADQPCGQYVTQGRTNMEGLHERWFLRRSVLSLPQEKRGANCILYEWRRVGLFMNANYTAAAAAAAAAASSAIVVGSYS